MDSGKSALKTGSPDEKQGRAKSRVHAETELEHSHPEKTPASAESSDEPTPESKPFDFGGLPDRNLKKNLGCG
jgi:hypothetical protein